MIYCFGGFVIAPGSALLGKGNARAPSDMATSWPGQSRALAMRHMCEFMRTRVLMHWCVRAGTGGEPAPCGVRKKQIVWRVRTWAD